MLRLWYTVPDPNRVVSTPRWIASEGSYRKPRHQGAATLTNHAHASNPAEPTASTPPRLAHTVFFALKDSSDEARQQLIDACHRYLSDHPGTLFFGVGPRAADYQRSVNDTRFDVVLHLVFATQADHDRYQQAPNHQQFIDESQAHWANVRVFDSYI